ncbi:MAG: secretion system protein, partial [Phycisphaerae bacterium]
VSQGGATAGSITIEYKEFGVRLIFAPTIMPDDVVRMRIVAEVSDLIPGTVINAGGLPVFNLSSRRVESTVEVGSGQTFAIGGLLSERVQALSSKIPGLGDLPVLGALFSSVRYQRNETELVILVTPQLVAPLHPHQVPPVPGSDSVPPDDYELFALQQLEGATVASTGGSRGVPRHRFPARVRPAARSTAPDRQEPPALQGPFGQSDFEEQ